MVTTWGEEEGGQGEIRRDGGIEMWGEVLGLGRLAVLETRMPKTVIILDRFHCTLISCANI